MNLKKILSSVLAAAMVLSTMSFSVLANNTVSTWDGTAVDRSWYDADPTATSYTIITAAQFAGLAEICNTFPSNTSAYPFKGQTIYLDVDIDLDGHKFAPIGDASADKRYFYGSFDGQGHTVSNIYIESSSAKFTGLFGKTGTSDYSQSFKDVTLDNVTIAASGTQQVGGLIGRADKAVVSGVNVTGEINITGHSFVGGIIGHSYAQISDCNVNAYGTISASGNWQAGGIVGTHYASADASISNCSVNGDTENGGISIYAYNGAVAGVAGKVWEVDGVTTTILDNLSASNVAVTATNNYGIGYIHSGDHVSTNSTYKNVTSEINGEVVEPDDADAVTAIVAMIGTTEYTSLQQAVNEATDGDTIVLLGKINEGSIKLPAVISNLTIDGQGTAVVKDTTINSSDGNLVNYQGLTFNNIIFDNSNIVMTGWRTQGEIYKNLAFTNNIFKNIVRATNHAAIHLNCASNYPIEGLTITNNIIDGVSGTSNSGIYTTAIDGETIVKGNTIKNVAFRPFILQVTNNNGTDDSVRVEDNTFSDSPVGRLQILGTNASGTDAVDVVITNNIIHNVTNDFELCCWKFNDETTTKTLSGNYWGAGVANNYNDFYWNGTAQSNEDLVDLGIFPVYTELNPDGTIDTSSIDTGEAYAAAKVDNVMYTSLQDAINAAADGATVTLLNNIDIEDSTIVNSKKIILDLNGKVISGGKADKATAGHEMILNKGELTIIDSANGGKITYEYTGDSTQFSTATNVITNNPGALLVIESGTFENKTNVSSHATYVIDARTNGSAGDSSVIINGGTILATKVAAIRGFANSTTNTVNITINDGNITGYAYIQDSNNSANKGNMTINGGTFNAVNDSYAVYMYGSGDASNISSTISNGTFNGEVYLTGNYITKNFNASITGGTFNDSVWINAWNNGVSTALKAISGGSYSNTLDSAYLADGFALSKTADGYDVVPTSKLADILSIEFKDVTATDAEGEKTYEIYVVADEGDKINDLESVDLTFEFDPTPVDNSEMKYSIASKKGITLTKKAEDRYMFSCDGVTIEEEWGEKVLLGEVIFTGYGSFKFNTKAVDINIVNATTIKDNLVHSYTVSGANDTDASTGALIINDDIIAGDDMDGVIDGEDGEITIPSRNLTINVTFPNAVDANVAAYQDMQVVISGGDITPATADTFKYALGEDMTTGGKYVVNAELTKGRTYTVTVSGAGYRTFAYDVTMDNAKDTVKELTFWNNVMDTPKVVEKDNDDSTETVTFLAGDIVKDDNINIYDLSAVVSYFATKTDTNTADDNRQYDLNRDGMIDSKDVAYVLVSWGK